MPKTSLLSKLPKALRTRLKASDAWFGRSSAEMARTPVGRAYARAKARG
ncbi:MAG TPA: hypothetical protein VKZ18_11765 [Polyangia bacterium]|nr:hypothetical protein [Polyangia bacterium]